MAETSTIFGFMKYVSATDILSDFKKTVDSHFVNSLKTENLCLSYFVFIKSLPLIGKQMMLSIVFYFFMLYLSTIIFRYVSYLDSIHILYSTYPPDKV